MWPKNVLLAGGFQFHPGGNPVPPYKKLVSSLPKSAKNKTSSRPPHLGLPSHCPRPRRILRGAPQKIKPLLNSSTAFARQLLLLAFARAAVRPPEQLSYVYIIRRGYCQGGPARTISTRQNNNAPMQLAHFAPAIALNALLLLLNSQLASRRQRLWI